MCKTMQELEKKRAFWGEAVDTATGPTKETARNAQSYRRQNLG